MTQNIQNISDIESRATMTVMAGDLPHETRRELSHAYFQLYFGMSWTNWIRPNMSLGRAWQTALTQINTFVSTRDMKNPAAAYLGRINAAHQRAWPKNIMTNPRRDGILAQNPERMNEWRAYGTKQIESAMTTIAIIIARYTVRDVDMQQTQKQTNIAHEKASANIATVPPAMAAAQPQTKQQRMANEMPMPAQMPKTLTDTNAKPVAKPVIAERAARPAMPIVKRATNPVAEQIHNMPQTMVKKTAGAKPMPNDMMRTIPTNAPKRALATNPTETKTVELRGPRASRSARPIVARPENRAEKLNTATARVVQMAAIRERPRKMTPQQIMWLTQYGNHRAA